MDNNRGPTPPPPPRTSAFAASSLSSSAAARPPRSSTTLSSGVALSSSSARSRPSPYPPPLSARRSSYGGSSRGHGASASGSRRIAPSPLRGGGSGHARGTSPPPSSTFYNELMAVRRVSADLERLMSPTSVMPRQSRMTSAMSGSGLPLMSTTGTSSRFAQPSPSLQQQPQKQEMQPWSSWYSRQQPVPSSSLSGLSPSPSPSSSTYAGPPHVPSGTYSVLLQSPSSSMESRRSISGFRQPSSSSVTYSGPSRVTTTVTSGSFSGFPPSPSPSTTSGSTGLSQSSPSSSTYSNPWHVPTGSYYGFPQSPSKKQQEQAQPSFTTTPINLLPLPGSLSGYYPQSPSQHQPQPPSTTTQSNLLPVPALQEQQQMPWNNNNTYNNLFGLSSQSSSYLPPLVSPASNGDSFSGTGLTPTSPGSAHHELPSLLPNGNGTNLDMPLVRAKVEPMDLDDPPLLEPDLVIILDGGEQVALADDAPTLSQVGNGGSINQTPPTPVSGNNNPMGIGGSSSSGCTSFGRFPWEWPGLTMEEANNQWKLMLGGMAVARPRQLPSGGTSTSSSTLRKVPLRDIFTDDELKTIFMEKHLSEIASTDPKRVKKILGNRVASARVKTCHDNNHLNLEKQFQALKTDNTSLCTEVALQQARYTELNTMNDELKIKLQGTEEAAKQKQDMNELFKEEKQTTHAVELNHPQHGKSASNQLEEEPPLVQQEEWPRQPDPDADMELELFLAGFI
ncbi:hypothetical protein ACP4OV_031229 [Aristida adscensionis]